MEHVVFSENCINYSPELPVPLTIYVQHLGGPPDQFDFVIHVDNARALEPLERSSQWVAGEFEETYPFGV